jgi:hypothetical protein
VRVVEFGLRESIQLGRGFPSQGIHLHENQWHRQIRGS